MATPHLSFMILTRNRRASLRRTLDSLCAQEGGAREIIVVDNGSQDGTAAMVEAQFPDVRLLRQERNTGAAGGKNIGLHAARGEVILCLDDDVTLEKADAAQRVAARFAADDTLGALSLRLLDAQTGQTDPRGIPRRDKVPPEGEAILGYFLGGACAFRRAALIRTGYYWEALNPYGAEEFDLSYRLIEAGYVIHYAHDIAATHHDAPEGKPKGRKPYALARNHPLVAARHLPWRYVFSHYLLWWAYALKIALAEGALSAWVRGVLAGLRDLPQALRLRRVLSARSLAIIRYGGGPLWY